MAIGEVLDVVAETRIRGLATVVEHAGRTAASAGVEVGDALRSVAEVLDRVWGREFGGGPGSPAATAEELEGRARSAQEEAFEAGDRLRAGRARLAAADGDAALRLSRPAGR